MDNLVDTFANRLTYALTIRNMKPIELAEKTKIDKSKISSYMSGRYKAKTDGLKLIADALSVSPVWLMGYDVPMEREFRQDDVLEKGSHIYNVPYYGSISAGIPNWAEECLEGYLPIDPQLMHILNPEEYFFLKVDGESMNKVVKNGAYALIHKQDVVNDGEIAVVLVNGYEATIKEFSKKNDIVVLTPHSDDTSFKQQIYDRTTPIRVLGKYVGKLEIN